MVLRAGEAKITIPDRFGRAFVPEKWFEVPIEAIDEAIQRVQDGYRELLLRSRVRNYISSVEECGRPQIALIALTKRSSSLLRNA